MADIRVENLTRGQILATAACAADHAWTRMRGLIGHKPLAAGEGLLIIPCSSIHTHFMSFPIDAMYLNRAQQVVGIDEHLNPWRFGRFYRRVHVVLELPAGTAGATGTRVGDQLLVQGCEL